MPYAGSLFTCEEMGSEAPSNMILFRSTRCSWVEPRGWLFFICSCLSFACPSVVAEKWEGEVVLEKPADGGFEGSAKGQAPLHWEVWNTAPVSATVVNESPKFGDHALRIYGAGASKNRNQATVHQTINAKEFRGQRVEITAWLRTAKESADVELVLWCAVARNSGEGGGPPQAMSNPVRQTDWSLAKLSVDIDEKSRLLHSVSHLRGSVRLLW